MWLYAKANDCPSLIMLIDCINGDDEEKGAANVGIPVDYISIHVANLSGNKEQSGYA